MSFQTVYGEIDLYFRVKLFDGYLDKHMKFLLQLNGSIKTFGLNDWTVAKNPSKKKNHWLNTGRK
ncbi:MAG: hypothetical protein ACTSO4_17820 [Promethearchaeota archaeon]